MIGVVQYNLYERLPSDYVLVGSAVPPKMVFDLPGLSPGVHTFALTAVSALMESAPSNEVTVSSLDYASSATIPITSSKDSKGKGSPYPTQIKVSGVAVPVSNIQVMLHGLTCPAASTLDILLQGPRGQKVLLMSDVGGNNPIGSANLVFSDDAVRSMSANAISSGNYKPTNLNPTVDPDAFPKPAPGKPYSNSLSAFNGTDPNGNWKLFVLNETTTGSASISRGWTIRFSATPIVTAGLATGITSTTATLTGTINPMGQASTSAFYFGVTTQYTSGQSAQNVGSSLSPMPIALSLTGLKPGTTYHYQLTGQNAFGLGSSGDVTFATLSLVDSDRDGMPDDYELLNHLNPYSGTDAVRDSDGDGLSNAQEYLAGTNPLDRGSALRVLAFQRSGLTSVKFSSALGKLYKVQRTADLMRPAWAVVEDAISGTGDPITIEDFSVPSLTTAFYRVAVLP